MFSGSKFGIILFKALIFCVVFGAIGAGIDFLYTNFLDVSGADTITETPAASDGAVGQTVDITIQDEDLPAAENAPGFFVGANRQMLNPEDSADSPSPAENAEHGIARTDGYVPVMQPETPSPVAPSDSISAVKDSASAEKTPDTASAKSSSSNDNAPAQDFVPISLAENVPDVAETSEKSIASDKHSREAANESPHAAETEELGVLPDLEDMENLVPDIPMDNSSGGNDESGGDYAPVAQKRKSSASAGATDAETMAKAISTLLTKEKN